MVWRVALLGLILLPATFSSAATRNANSCSASDVQTALNQAADGDIVQVPAGSCTWTSAVSGPCTSWTLQGAGAGSTNITISGGVVGMGCTNKTQRVTGFTWINSSTGTHGIFDIGGTGGSPWSFRIDHNTIRDNGSWHRWGWVEGPCTSNGCVVDHNTITNLAFMVSGEVAGSGGDGSPTTIPGTSTACGSADNCAGATQWNKPMVLDNGSEVYFEDNTFTFSSFFSNDMLDCQNGGRYVFRHNTVTGNDIFNHGFDSVASSCIELTAYQNTFKTGGSNTGQLGVLFRGGTGLIYSNIMSGSGQGIHLTNYRSNNSGANSCPQGYTQNGISCGSSGVGSWCLGSNPADQNVSGQHGYACFEQIGRGSGPKAWSGGSNSYNYPLYVWDNCTTSLGCTGTSGQVKASVYNNNGGSTDYTTSQIVANRDFYDSTNSFTGASGIGIGPLANRPSTCTQGVAYWATDQNRLYNCAGSNTWAAYYTPFAYPHPLVSNTTSGGGAPASPTNLVAVTN